MTGAGDDRALVLYDLDCGFCRWTLARLLAWDRHRRLQPVAIQDDAGREALRDLDEETRLASWHLVLPDGRRLSGGPALPAVVALLPRGRRLSRILAAAAPLTNRAYDLVARHRWIPGRLLSDAAVERATARIRARTSG